MHGNAELLSISKGYGVSGGQHTFIKPLICCRQGACSQCFQDNESYILTVKCVNSYVQISYSGYDHLKNISIF